MATKIKAGYHKTIDGGKDLKYKISSKPDKRGLCHKCEQIPFGDYLPSVCASPRSQTSTLRDKTAVFCLKLEDIVAHQHWCKFCGLLYKSICRPEYDLFKAEHISKHLKTSEKLKDIKTFEQWVTTFSTWEKWTEGEDIWPFGYTRDQKEAAKEAEATAMELFREAEDRDLKAGTVDGMYDTDDALEKALHIGTLAFGVGGLANGGKAWAGGQMAMSHMAIFGMGRAKALPCLFMVRAYPRGEEKDGVLSVRVFAHGRAPRAPLKEISHFSLRLEQSEPRPQGAQLWYGRTLKPRIDVPFFEKCLVACQLLHGDTCGKFSWPSSQLDQQAIDRKYPIRFIDVQRMQIVQESFSRIIQPAPHPDHRSYVVLSYTWGHQEWTEHTDPEGRKILQIIG
jgi:hypothetical protein